MISDISEQCCRFARATEVLPALSHSKPEGGSVPQCSVPQSWVHRQGDCNGNFKHGLHSREAKAIRRAMRAKIREIKALIPADNPRRPD
jgi:hypothetical protein